MSSNLLQETIFTNQAQAEDDMCYFQTVKAGATPETSKPESSSTVSRYSTHGTNLFITNVFLTKVLDNWYLLYIFLAGDFVDTSTNCRCQKADSKLFKWV